MKERKTKSDTFWDLLASRDLLIYTTDYTLRGTHNVKILIDD